MSNEDRMQLNFLNDYYKNRSTDQNPSDIVNMYLEEDKSNGKYPVVAFDTPGLSVFNSGAGNVVRGSIEHRGVYYAVVDNTFYSYASNGVRTSRGTLNTSSGLVELADISNQIMIVDGTNGYNYNTNTTTFATISDLDFPANPTYLAAQDEFFLVGVANSSAIYGSDVSDGTSWNALSFASKSGHGDYVNGIISNKGLVYVFGAKMSDTWNNSGAPTFSFESSGLGGILEYGCAAKNSVAKSIGAAFPQGNSSVFLLSQSESGGVEVIQVQLYSVKVVSNRAVAYQINQLTSISDAIGYCYKKSGHEFYVLTFPTDAVTFLYDISTGLWSTLKSYVNSAYTRHLSNCYSYCYGKHLVGAYNSGTIYMLDDTVYQDNGAQRLRLITSPPGYKQGKKVTCHRIQIDVQTNVGSNLSVTLNVSKDTGTSYPLNYTGTIPSSGGRMFWSRLGQTQDAFVFQLSTIANAKFCVLGAQADIEVGVH